jgi:lipopolysaccharide transport system ATP-binding protein
MAAIRVDRLSKRYQVNAPELAASSFRDLLAQFATAPLRRLRHLGGGGPSFWALRDLSFDVEPGEVVGVVGRNGAGKSTLLKILSRITDPTGGRVELRGRVGSLLEVGTGFHPDLTGRENVFLNGAILGMPRAEIRRKFDAIVEFAEIARFIDTPVKHYSSGMYLRLAFSVAAHLEGEILLVDEVLAVGDAAFQKKCLGKMQDVGRGGRTVLFVSHNMGAVSALCSRGLVIDEGRLVFDASAQQAVRYYLEHDLADSACVWELDAAPRTRDDLGALARIERVSVLPAVGDGIRCGDPLRFRIELRAQATIDDLACAIGLDDIFGSRVVTFESDRERTRVDARAGRRYVVDVTVPPFGLLPGRYMLSVSLYAGATYHDFAVHFGAVAVTPLAAEGGVVEERPDRGAIAARSEWRVSAAEAAGA